MRNGWTLAGALAVGGVLAAACASGRSPGEEGGAIPPGALDATARLNSSPRHGEWAMIGTGASDSVRAWVVYPERSDKAPVVVVIHEIFGLTPWIRGVADQLAADGFIAIAPDLLTSKNLSGSPEDGPPADQATAAIRTLDQVVVQRQLTAVARYGTALPAATQRYGVVGFCWGGSTSFEHALLAPDVGAAVVYYGSTPANASFSATRTPVLGLYGGDDNRVNATIPAADSGMRAAGRSFESHVFAGAGHGFLRAQADSVRGTANKAASVEAWPLTVAFFRRHLGS
jgi:carboxymethylenebutenolidase